MLELGGHGYTTLARYVAGLAIQARRPELGQDESASRVSARLRELDGSRFPATVAVADALPIALRAEFDYGLDLLLTGARVERRARRARSRP